MSHFRDHCILYYMIIIMNRIVIIFFIILVKNIYFDGLLVMAAYFGIG